MEEVTHEKIVQALSGPSLDELRRLMGDTWANETVEIAASAFIGIDEHLRALPIPDHDPDLYLKVTAMVASCLLAGYLRDLTLRSLNAADHFEDEERAERTAGVVLNPEAWNGGQC